MKEYDSYVPLVFKAGRRLPISQLENLKKSLVKKFGGLTYFPQKTKGFWKIGKATFHDAIVILRGIGGKKLQTLLETIETRLAKRMEAKGNSHRRQEGQDFDLKLKSAQ